MHPKKFWNEFRLLKWPNEMFVGMWFDDDNVSMRYTSIIEEAISQTQDTEDYEKGATSGAVPKGTGPLGNVYEPSPEVSLANLLKMTTGAISKAPTAINTALNTAQNTQQQSNLANMLRGTQMAQTALPPIYKQANPFNFGQQNQPVQDVSALAKLLRTA